MTIEKTTNDKNKPNFVTSAADQEPEDQCSQEYYDWVRRQDAKRFQSVAKPVTPSESHLRSVTTVSDAATRMLFDSGSVDYQKNSAGDDLRCKGSCGRKSQWPRKHRCSICHKLVREDALLHEHCARANNRCPVCGKHHGRGPDQDDDKDHDEAVHYDPNWQKDIDS